jgi:hypothetical protein
METRILGIVGNILFIQGFYAGDNYHELIIPTYEIDVFIESGIPVYDNIGYIECQVHGMEYDQYIDYVNNYNTSSSEFISEPEGELPF